MGKMTRMFFFALFAGALASGPYADNVFAQEENTAKKVAVATFGGPGIGGTGIGAVKNAPFSGEIVCECAQTLADGNRIVQRSTTIIHRDAAGRSRRESSFKIRDASTGEDREYKTIKVSDPFSGQSFTLDPQNRTAHKITIRPLNGNGGVVEIQPVTIAGVGAPTAGAIAPGIPLRGAISGPALVAPGIACAPGPIRPFGGFGINAEHRDESLGSQMIEGVMAEGTRITVTIPAGSMGNERPINATYERWRSKALQMDLLIKSVDPRSGEATQQITNLTLGDPDPALFEIPPDYTIQEIMTSAPLLAGARLDNTAGANTPGQRTIMRTGDFGVQGPVHPMSASLRPTILYREKARYTEEARQNRVEGTVVLSVVFNVNGAITDIMVVRGLPDALTEKAIEAARKIRFQPAVKDGMPVSVRGSLEFTFNL
ncbi:MAG TPA: energy transducer TonB [Blastocatellia bacterium]